MKHLNLFSLFRIAVKHIYLLITVGVICGLLAFGYCKFIATPKYTASGSVIVTNGTIINQDQFNNGDISATINFTTTVKDILSTKGIFKNLAEDTNHQYNASQLFSMASIKKRDQLSMFVDVSFTCESADEAVRLVNGYLEIAPEYINSSIPGATTAFFTADNAYLNYPNTINTTITSAALGLVITYAILVIIHSANTIIRDERDFKDHFKVPVLGCVPDFNNAKSDKTYSYYGKGGN